MIYVVAHFTRGVNEPGPHETKQYLEAINYNPYNRQDQQGLRTSFCDDKFMAFRFTKKSAAEFAAVFVGGHVEELPQ